MVSILFERPSGESGLITLDATINEDHRSSALVTQHSVETGANITDHIRPENDRLNLRFIISNTPAVVPGSNLDGAIGAVQPLEFSVPVPARRQGPPVVTQAARPGQFEPGRLTRPIEPVVSPAELSPQSRLVQGATVLQFSQQFDRVRSVYQELLGLIRDGILVSVVTSLRTYTDMALSDLTIPRTSESGSALEFNVVATQIRIVETETVSAPVPVQSRAKNRRKKGGQETQESSSEQTKRSSFIHNIYSSAGIL